MDWHFTEGIKNVPSTWSFCCLLGRESKEPSRHCIISFSLSWYQLKQYKDLKLKTIFALKIASYCGKSKRSHCEWFNINISDTILKSVPSFLCFVTTQGSTDKSPKRIILLYFILSWCHKHCTLKPSQYNRCHSGKK